MKKFPIDKIIASFEGRLAADDSALLQKWLAASAEHQQQHKPVQPQKP